VLTTTTTTTTLLLTFGEDDHVGRRLHGHLQGDIRGSSTHETNYRSRRRRMSDGDGALAAEVAAVVVVVVGGGGVEVLVGVVDALAW